MEVLINGVVGFVVVPIYNLLKKKWKLEGKAAAWVLFSLVAPLAMLLVLGQGALGVVEFDIANPITFLENIGKAYGIIIGAASGLYAVVKKPT